MLHFTYLILALILRYDALSGQGRFERLEDILEDCRSNKLKQKVCLGFTGEDQNIRSRDECAYRFKSKCTMVLRAQIPNEHEGEWDAPIKLTLGVTHEPTDSAIPPLPWNAFIVLSKQNPDLTLIFGAFRTSMGEFGNATLMEAGQDQIKILNHSVPFEISGDPTTLAFSITLPSTVQVVSDHYALDMFTKVALSYGTESSFQWITSVQLNDGQREDIMKNPGYKYAGCERKDMRCLSIAPGSDGREECIKLGNCPVLVRLKSRANDSLVLYLNRNIQVGLAGYISAGFSTDRAMGNTLVFDCIKYVNSTITALSYNDHYQNKNYVASRHISSYHRFSRGNSLECLWTISTKGSYVTPGFNLTFDLDAYFVLRAVGGISRRMMQSKVDTGSLGKLKHTATAVTARKFRIFPEEITYETVSDSSKVTHKETSAVQFNISTVVGTGINTDSTFKAGMSDTGMFISIILGIMLAVSTSLTLILIYVIVKRHKRDAKLKKYDDKSNQL